MSFLCIELFMGTDINALYIPTVFSILLLYILLLYIITNFAILRKLVFVPNFSSGNWEILINEEKLNAVLCYLELCLFHGPASQYKYEEKYSTVQKSGVRKIYLLNKLILLFSKDALNRSKVTVNTFIMFQKCIIQINAVFKDHVTLKTGVMILKIQLWSKE